LIAPAEGGTAEHPAKCGTLGRGGKERGLGGKGIPAPPSLFRRRNFSYFALQNAQP